MVKGLLALLALAAILGTVADILDGGQGPVGVPELEGRPVSPPLPNLTRTAILRRVFDAAPRGFAPDVSLSADELITAYVLIQEMKTVPELAGRQI